MLGNESNKKSFWAKVGEVAKKGAEIIGKVLGLIPRAAIYPVKKPFAQVSEAKHDAINALKSVVGIKGEKYNRPIETTQASKNLGVEIKEYKKGKVRFIASRTLTGDIPHLSTEQLDKIKKDLPNITIYGEENKVVIEIDVEKIINDIKADPKNEGMNKEEIKKLALKEIAKEVDSNLKGLAKITDGEFKRHKDLKLLNGIAEKLYKEYDNQKPSETVRPIVGQSSETLKSVNSRTSETVRALAGNGQKPNEAFKRLDSSISSEAIRAAQQLVDSDGKSAGAEKGREILNERNCNTGRTR